MTAMEIDYPTFHRALYPRQEPLPWQARLARRVADGGWPTLVGIPTGLGKTTCIDIAVWALQHQHDRDPIDRTAPTRTWYVVNRRLLVDAAYERATRIARFLADPSGAATNEGRTIEPRDEEVLTTIAGRLMKMGASTSDNGMPMHVALMRGGTDLSDRPLDPSQPALMFATVPMFASRWLFRGYGSSRTMRPIDAALAGVDSLVLLDEAHLSRPLLKLAEQAAECDLGDPTKVVPRRSRPVIVPLTATGDREKGDDVFELGDEDLAHPVVQQRLSARKPLAMVECKRTTLSKTLAAEASRLHDAIPGAAVVVFANSPRTAREVARLLSPKKDTAPEVVLLTGLMREREADATRQRLLAADGGVASGRALVARPRSLTVVATQTLEVGADLDFDGLVTETAGVRALVQRLGRLNRLGARNDHADLIATAVLCHPTDTKDDGLYGKEPNDLWSHLVEKGANGTDLGPANAAAALEVPTTASGRSGELLPTHLWEMAKTTQPPPGEAPPEVFYDEIGEPDRSVAVAWRTWLPDVEKKERLEPPLIGTESVDVPLGALRELLEEREMAMVTVLDADRARLQEIPRDQLHPGHQVVLSSGVGGYGEDGWNLSSRVPVLDIGSLEASTLVVSSAAVSGLLAPDDTSSRKALDDLATQIVDEELDDDAAIAAEVVAILEAALPHPWLLASGLDRDGSASPPKWDAFIDGFRFRGRGTVHTEATLTGPALVKGSRSSTTRPHLQVAIDALDDLSFPAKSAALADHLGSVGAHARHIARQVGLTPELIDLVAQAGADHDLGKHDPRFQRWLGANPDEPLAKSGRRPDHTGTLQQASGWPRGGRHEALSGRILQAHDPHVDPLRLHLVLSHHGRGRPSFEPVADSSPTTFIVNMDGIDVEVDGDLSTVDWDQPARFRSLCEQYGVWGVALLEAIVRQADHQVSSVVEVV